MLVELRGILAQRKVIQLAVPRIGCGIDQIPALYHSKCNDFFLTKQEINKLHINCNSFADSEAQRKKRENFRNDLKLIIQQKNVN